MESNYCCEKCFQLFRNYFEPKTPQKREQKLKNANNTKPYKTNKPLQNNGLKVLEAK